MVPIMWKFPLNHGFYWCLIWGMGLFYIIPQLSQWSMHVLMVPFQTVVNSHDANQVWRKTSHGDSMRRGVAAGKCCSEMLPLPSANQRWLADPLFIDVFFPIKTFILQWDCPLKPKFIVDLTWFTIKTSMLIRDFPGNITQMLTLQCVLRPQVTLWVHWGAIAQVSETWVWGFLFKGGTPISGWVYFMEHPIFWYFLGVGVTVPWLGNIKDITKNYSSHLVDHIPNGS